MCRVFSGFCAAKWRRTTKLDLVTSRLSLERFSAFLIEVLRRGSGDAVEVRDRPREKRRSGGREGGDLSAE